MSNESESKSSQRSYRDILEVEIEEGLRQLDRPTDGVLLSGLSAGLDVGFSVFLMATMLTLTRDVLPDPVTEILVGGAIFAWLSTIIGPQLGVIDPSAFAEE